MVSSVRNLNMRGDYEALLKTLWRRALARYLWRHLTHQPSSINLILNIITTSIRSLQSKISCRQGSPASISEYRHLERHSHHSVAMADREAPYDPYIPSGAGAPGGSQGQHGGNQRTAALQAVGSHYTFCHTCDVADDCYRIETSAMGCVTAATIDTCAAPINVTTRHHFGIRQISRTPVRLPSTYQPDIISASARSREVPCCAKGITGAR